MLLQNSSRSFAACRLRPDSFWDFGAL